MSRLDFNDAGRLRLSASGELEVVPANDPLPVPPQHRVDQLGYSTVAGTDRQSRFTVEDFDTLRPASQSWIVKGLWPRVGVCMVAGPSMSGKSFLVADACAKVCRGEPFLSLKSKACGVLYIASEDPGGIRLRIEALRSRVGNLGGRFKLIGQPPNLCDEDELADLRTTISDTKAGMARAGHRLGIVVIDTFSTSIPGADENSAKDMSPVLNALQALALDSGLLVLVIAHTGKDEARGVRGWSGLLANADGLIQLDKFKPGQPRTGTVEKVKNGEAGRVFAFELEVVELGRDEDGDPITTCVVVDAEVSDATPAPKRLKGNARIVAQALGYLVDHGHTHPVPAGAGIAPDQRAVLMSDWKARAGEMGLFDPDDTPDNRRQKFHRAKVDCRDAGLVRIEGDWAIPLPRDVP